MPSIFFSCTSSAIFSISLRLVDLKRNFGNDDAFLVALLLFFDKGLGPHFKNAAAGPVGGINAFPAVNKGAGGEIRPGNNLHELFDGHLGVMDKRDKPVTQLHKIVGRNIRGHADGNPGRPVQQQVRHPGRQHRGLFKRAVIGGAEINRLFFNIGQQLAGYFGHAHFGIAHGRRRIAVHGAEIALAVDQGVAHGKILRHAHDGVIHGGIAMGMILADNIADDTG